ncbi:MAG: hypothetical protein ACRDWV_07030, partial [Acidimicrobiales bacterium]
LQRQPPKRCLRASGLRPEGGCAPQTRSVVRASVECRGAIHPSVRARLVPKESLSSFGWVEASIDPVSGLLAEVRQVQPYQAVKHYQCPGCNQEIAIGAGHVVVVPTEAPDLRRHWHRACWERRGTRRPGRATEGMGGGGGRRGPPASR